MKSTIHALAILLVLLIQSCAGNAQEATTQPQTLSEKQNVIEVLDFHTDHRCKTCITIEKQVKGLLQKSYENELSNGTITFRLVNADEEDNLELVRKYGAFGTSLIINVVKDGKESFVDLTDFAFMNVNNQEKFDKELHAQLTDALQSLKI